MLRLLGPTCTCRDGTFRPLPLRPKALALLVRAALAGPCPRADLADELFSDADDPRAALRWYLTHLRARLPEPERHHLATAERVAFTGPTDVRAFERDAARLVDHPDQAAAADVLALYRGDLCAGLTVAASAVFDTWLYVEQERLRRVFRQATVAVARHAIGGAEAGAAARVAGPLARLVTVDPYFEEGHCLLIDAHELAGRRDAALAAYQRYARLLRQELHLEPPHELARRYEPETPAGRTRPDDRLVPLPALTLHVVDWPGGEPAILAVHGSTMHAYTFTALAERLAPDVRFVAVDLRGHGFSDKPPGGYTVAQHVEDLRALSDALGLRRPVLLGFSIGGAIAAFAAARGGCSGLILLDAVIGDGAFTSNAAALVSPWSATLGMRFGGFEEYVTRMRAQHVPYTDEAERILDRTLRYELAPLPDGTYRRRALRAAFEETWASLLQADSLAALAEVRCPTLIVHATRPWIEGRPYLTAETIAAQRKVVPQARLAVARRSNHPLLVRDPEPEIVEALRSFVRSVAAPPA